MKVLSRIPWPALATLAVLILGSALPLQAEQPSLHRHFKPAIEEIDVDCPNCGWNTVELRSNGIPSRNAVVPFKQGETCPVCGGRGRLTSRIDWQHGYFLVEGFGVPPEDLVREYVETRSRRLLARMRIQAMRAAQLDCYRNAVRLASQVRLDGDRFLGDMAQELRGRVRMWEEVGDGEWIEKNVSFPFFKKLLKVPIWGAEGVVGVFYNTQIEKLRKKIEKKKPFDWRKALNEYEKHPERFEPAHDLPPGPSGSDTPAQPGGDETPSQPGEDEPPSPPSHGETPPQPSPGETPAQPSPGETPAQPSPGETPAQPSPGETPAQPSPGETPAQPSPGETPAQPAPGETPPQPGGTEPGEVEPPAYDPSEEEEVPEYDEVFFDARGLEEDGEPLNPAMYPEVQFEDANGKVHSVYDLSEVEESEASETGMVHYVTSNTPFEKISQLAGPRALVIRVFEIRRTPVRVAGLNLPLLFQQGVDFGGKKGQKKHKYEFKFKAVKATGLQKANIMISARDALELKKTDEATKVLKNCKVIIISGGDIAGKEGKKGFDARWAKK